MDILTVYSLQNYLSQYSKICYKCKDNAWPYISIFFHQKHDQQHLQPDQKITSLDLISWNAIIACSWYKQLLLLKSKTIHSESLSQSNPHVQFVLQPSGLGKVWKLVNFTCFHSFISPLCSKGSSVWTSKTNMIYNTDK